MDVKLSLLPKRSDKTGVFGRRAIMIFAHRGLHFAQSVAAADVIGGRGARAKDFPIAIRTSGEVASSRRASALNCA
jgi:hypothetical protein